MQKIDRRAITALFLSATALVTLVMSEGYRDQAYPDSGKIYTYGFGSTRKLDGTPVKKGDTITPPQALTLAMQEVMVMEAALKKCITVDLYQHEYNAFMELSYNIGTGAFCTSSIPRKLAMHDYAGACATILEFDKYRDSSKPKVKNPKTGKMEYPLMRLKGLTNRRQREYRQCQGCMTCHVTIP
jgi:lysozyme